MSKRFVIFRNIPGKPDNVGEIIGVTTRKGFDFLRMFSSKAGTSNKKALAHKDGSVTILGDQTTIESFPAENLKDFNEL